MGSLRLMKYSPIGRISWCAWLGTDNADACVCVRPQTRTLVFDLRIPCREVLQTDCIGRRNSGTVVTLLYEVKLVAVAYHTRLCRCRGADAIC